MKYTWMLTLCAMGSVFADGALSSAELAVAAPTVEVKVEPTPVAPQYKNRFGFSLGRLVYERTEADCMYFGLDVWSVAKPGKYRHHLDEVEARLGYNLFFNGRDHFTPVGGVGYMYNNVGKTFHHAKFAYATAGFLYSHEFDSVFGLGFNLKGLVGQQLAKSETKKFAWGIDASLPISFRFARERKWDITLEPFTLFMNSDHKHQGVFGGRGTVGYRF